MQPRVLAKWPYSLLALAVLASGCMPTRGFESLRGKAKNNAPAQPSTQNNAQNPTPRASETTPYKPSRQFGVFDDKYDFVKDGVTNATKLAERFPTHAGDQSEITLLESASDFLTARMDLLDSAQSTVDIQILAMHGDDAGWKFTEKLLALKQRGVRVRMIVDAVSNIELPAQSMFFKLKQAGIEIEGWEALYLYVLSMYRPTDGLAEFFDEGNRRYHEKMFIVDAGTPNAHAIVGGTNIGNKYFRLDPTKPLMMWRDKDVMLKGPVVADIQRMFETNRTAIQEFKNNQAIFNTDPIWQWVNYAKDVLKLKPMTVIDTPEYNPVVLQNYNAALLKPRTLSWKPATMRYLHSRPRMKEFYIHRAYIDFIESAKSEILILNSYFLPMPDMQKALKDAVKRGVNVKIITNHKDVNDIPAVTTAARTLYKNLLDANTGNPNNAKIEIYEWAGHPVFQNGEGLHHGKYAVFDRKASIVGSFNIDPRSETLNSECIVAYEDEALSDILAKEFERDAKPGFSENISYEKALKFTDPDGFLDKIQTQLAVSFKPIL